MSKRLNFIKNILVSVVVIALSFMLQPVVSLPSAQAAEQGSLVTDPTVTDPTVTNPAVVDPVVTDPAAINSSANNLADPPPAPSGVSVSQPDLRSLRVTWNAPASPPANYTYTIELYNNVGALAITQTDIPQTDTEYLFTNLFAANYTATKVYTVSDDGISDAAISNTVIHNSLNGLDNFANFKDTGKLPQIAQDDIFWAQSYNIAHGFPDDNFYPAKNTTRAQMATFMRRLAGFPDMTKTPADFIDTAKSQHLGDIEWASSEGITTGYECTSKGQPVKECTQAGVKVFRPESFITREQMAIFMYQFAKSPIITANDKLQLSKFKDSFNITNETAKTAVSWLVKEKLTAGYPDGNFKASTKVTRQQMVIFLQSLAVELALMPYLPIEADYAYNFLNTGLVRNTITKISFSRLFPQCDAPIDISYNKFNGVKACVDGTELTIGEPAGVIANPQNSKYLFSDIGQGNTDASQFDFSYFNASKTKNMSHIFYYANLPAGFTMPDGFGSSALDMQYALYDIYGRGDITLPSGFGSVATNMYMMFAYTGAGTQAPYLLDNIYFPEGFGAEVTNTNYIFTQVWMNGSVILPSGFGSKVTTLNQEFQYFRADTLVLPEGFGSSYSSGRYVFEYATINNLSIPSSFNCNNVSCERFFESAKIMNSFHLPDDFAANATSVNGMFQSCILPAGFTIPKNFAKDAGYLGYSSLFSSSEFLGSVNISEGVLANQTDLNGIFSSSTFDAGLTIPDNFVPNATSLQYMFGGVKFLGPLTIGSGFGQNATNIQGLFGNAEFSAGLELPASLGQAATNMDYMFGDAKLNGDIDWSSTDLTASAATKANMFNNTTWNGYFMLAQNQTSVDWLIDGTGLADNTRVKVKGT